jgi:hypothetical protein
VEIRQAGLWTALLLAGQTTDVLTTALDRARGTLESMPVSARLMELGGLSLLGGTKLLLVVGAGTALLLTARWTRRGQPASRITFRFCLVAVQAATLGLAYVSLSNIALLSSLLN